VVDGARALEVGDPLDPGTDIGPLTTPDRVEQIDALVRDAVGRGGTLHCGGPRGERTYAPAVLSDVPPDAPLLREEVPGPVLAVTRVADVDEAIALANDTPYGLGASVWTTDRYHGERVARLLRCGMVWMNDHLVAPMAPALPWGGRGDSGLGRARGAEALLECAEAKVVTWDPPLLTPGHWMPYDRVSDAAARTVTLLRSSRDRDRSRAWRTGLGPLLRSGWRSARGDR